MLFRLLRRNVSVAQILGYALANLAGLAIVMTAVQFYCDVTSSSSDSETFFARDYLIISKKVEGLGSLMGKPVEFSQEEIDDLAAQPWARRVGRFTAAACNVYATVDMRGNSLGTSLFLESIPDEYFDVTPAGWSWQPGNPLPIVISKDYLALYNFGFAASAGLPQVSEAMVSTVPLRISVSGNGSQQWVNARIVGFSARLNTIAVPESFISWTNATFAEEPVPAPKRLIVEVSAPGDPAVTAYLADHSYETAGDKADSSRMIRFLTIVTGVVIAVGAVISLLAFFILLLSIYLILQKNRLKLHRLMELGYPPAAVARTYVMLVLAVNAGVLVLAAAATFACRRFWLDNLAELGLGNAGPLTVIAVGAAITLLVTILNIIAIRRRVLSAFRL